MRKFWLEEQTIFLFLIMAAILDGIWTNPKKLRMGTKQVLFLPSFVQIGSFISENKIFFLNISIISKTGRKQEQRKV